MTSGKNNVHVSVGGHRVDVGGETAAGTVNVEAILEDMRNQSAARRQDQTEDREKAEARTLQLTLLAERARRRGVHVGSYRDLWDVRARLWPVDSKHHECTQAKCRPVSMETGAQYRDPESGTEREALGYMYVCTASGAVHACTAARCTAAASNTTAGQRAYVCAVTGASYGQVLVTAGFRDLKDSLRNTQTLGRGTGVGAQKQNGVRKSVRRIPATPSNTKRALTLTERLRALRALPNKKRLQSLVLVRTLLYGVCAEENVRARTRKNAATVARADRVAAAAGGGWASLQAWLGVTARLRAPPRVQRAERYLEVVEYYVRVCEALWGLVLESPATVEKPQRLNWGNHVLATMYLLKRGLRVRCPPETRQECESHRVEVELIERDPYLHQRLPIAGTVDLSRHLRLGKRAFSKGTEAIQVALQRYVAGARSDAVLDTLVLSHYTRSLKVPTQLQRAWAATRQNG